MSDKIRAVEHGDSHTWIEVETFGNLFAWIWQFENRFNS